MMVYREDSSGWAIGWTVYAATMMLLLGLFHVFAGLLGVLGDELYVATSDYLLQLDPTTWGWIHLIVGAIAVLAGFGLFAGRVWARTLGVILAMVSLLANFAWLPWYPMWALVMIAVSLFVIWALTVHGRDIVEA